jgi:hypothetical protein
MKIDISQTLVGPSGLTLKMEDGSDATLGKILIVCLERNDPNAKAMDKYEQIKIAMRIADSVNESDGTVELTADQAAKVGKLCEWLPPAVVYHVYNALDLVSERT